MRSFAQVLADTNWYLDRYEEKVYPKFLTKYAGRPLGYRTVYSELVNLAGDDYDPYAANRVLDLGCGTGWYSRHIASNSEKSRITGVDLSKAAIRRANERAQAAGISFNRLNYCVGDITHSATSLGLGPHEHADEVWICGALHQMSNPGQVLRRIATVLAPGGRCFIQTCEEPQKHNEHVDIALMRWMGQNVMHPGELKRLATEAGLSEVGARQHQFIRLAVFSNPEKSPHV